MTQDVFTTEKRRPDSITFTERPTCTISEASAATGLGRSTIYLQIGAGTIETIKIGRRRLVRVASLLKMLDSKAA